MSNRLGLALLVCSLAYLIPHLVSRLRFPRSISALRAAKRMERRGKRMRRDEGRHEETDRTSSHEHGGVRDEPAEAIGGGMARTPRIHPAYRSYFLGSPLSCFTRLSPGLGSTLLLSLRSLPGRRRV